MSVGDTIECGNIDELLKVHDELCAEGYGVDFNYKQGKTAVLTITEVPEE